MMTATPVGADVARLRLRLETAYNELILSHPFFAVILMYLQRVEDPSCETMWTDGTRLGYNPEFVLALSPDELCGVLAHEAVHVVLLHPYRRQTRQPNAWNIACDHVDNDIVLSAGFALPGGHLKPIPDTTAEVLYKPELEQNENASGEGAGDSDIDGSPPEKDGKAGTGGKQKSGGKGRRADPGRCGEVRDAANVDGTPMTGAQRERAMAEVRVRVQQALNVQKRRGTLPAGLEHMVEQSLDPKTPWREILDRFVDHNSNKDLSWARPNRRYLAQGIVFPGLWSPGVADMLFAADTSGSVSDEDLNQVCTEILAALELYQERGEDVELHMLWCDAVVYPQTIICWDEALRPVGRGGTSFAPVFAYVEEHGLNPRGVIYATDGHCDEFGPPPPYPVLWILTKDHRHDFAPPFGEIAYIINDGDRG